MGQIIATNSLEKRAVRRVTFRLIPYLFLLYIVAYLDRINVGFAALQMNAELNLSNTVFGIGGGIFFIGYFLFEIPSNLILHRVGARLWIARIMVSWGLIAAAMMFVVGPKSFYMLRFLLGLAEAGFFPGVILYLTYWFPEKYLARTVALFMTATPLAGVIGGPVSGALLDMHGSGGLSGWQWLFLLEGMPAVVLGITTLFCLPEGPAKAAWIPEDEKEWLLSRLAEERSGKQVERERNLSQALKSRRVWGLCLVYFSLIVAMYGVTLWLPLIIKGLSTSSDFMVGIISLFPYLGAAVFMVMVGMSSDRTGERRFHVAACLTIAALGFFLSCSALSLAGKIVCLVIAAVGIWGALGPFWALAGSYLSGTGAAAGIALINSIGNLGGFTGPALMGFFRNSTGSYDRGLLVLGLIILLGGITACTMRQITNLPEGFRPLSQKITEDE
jgi:MFS transporter, ACS family, tartrate transporter